MSVGYIRIEPLHNGYTVELDDPAIVQANKKNDNRKTSEPYSYKDPSRKFTFKTDKEVLAFLTKNLKKIVPSKMDDFGTSFDLATKEDC